MKSMAHNQQTKNPTAAGQAVVIGGGMAGLTAARVLAQHHYQVTVIDRDRLPDGPAFRAGIPQAQHAHTLLPYGQMLLDGLFPGLVNELLTAGASLVDAEHDTAYSAEGDWRQPEPRSSRPVVSMSRPLLEDVLRRRVAALPEVRILAGVEAAGLVVDDLCAGVAGVTVRRRGEHDDAGEILPAALVVDASGRNSKAPQWLAELGCTPPEEWQIDAHAGYASRIYRKPAAYPESWKKLYVGPSPPDSRRGGKHPVLRGRWGAVRPARAARRVPDRRERSPGGRGRRGGFCSDPQSAPGAGSGHGAQRASPGRSGLSEHPSACHEHFRAWLWNARF